MRSRMLGGVVGEEDAATTPPRAPVSGLTVFGCCEIAQSLAHQSDPSSFHAFDYFESKPSDLLWQKAMTRGWPEPSSVAFFGRVLRAVVLCCDFCFLCF